MFVHFGNWPAREREKVFHFNTIEEEEKKKRVRRQTCSTVRNTHSYFWEKSKICWRRRREYKGPCGGSFILFHLSSSSSFLKIYRYAAGRGLGSSEASVALIYVLYAIASISLSHSLFIFICCVFFFFLLSLLLFLPRRKRILPFLLLNRSSWMMAGPCSDTHAQVKRGPFFSEPTGQMQLENKNKKKTFTGERLLHAREPLARHSFFLLHFFFLFYFGCQGNVDDDASVYLFHVG